MTSINYEAMSLDELRQYVLSHREREKHLLEMSDEDIDYSDIPPLDENFFKNAKLIE